MIFSFKQKSFGLDIGSRSLKLVQLKKQKDKAKLTSCSEIEVTDDIIKNGKIVKFDQFNHLIKELIKKSRGQKITTRQVATCLSEPNTFIKLISLTYPEGKNILEEVINESKKHIPYPLEKIYLDWQYVDKKDNSKVLIAVCPKEIVENCQEALNKAGLIPFCFEIEAAAICRCLLPLNQSLPEPVLILDIGATRTGLIAFQHETVLFSLSIAFSSDNLTKQLISGLGLSPDEAERAKKICGLDPNKAQGGVRKILEPLINELSRQIREAKYFYHEHFSKEKTLERLILTGGGGQLPYLSEYLEEKCQVKAELGNPLINLSINENNGLLLENYQSYSTAIGLALRNIQKE